MTKQIVDVLVPVALDQAYSYRVPAGLELAPGDLVRVPLGPRKATGAVWGHGVARPGLDNRLKDVAEKLEIPALKPELRNFIDWVADYTLSSRGMVLRMALRMGEQLGPERPRVAVRLAGPIPLRMTPARKKVLALLADGLLRPKRDVVEEAGVSPGVIDGLVDEGTLETAALAPEPVARPPGPDFAVPDLSPAQAEAAAALRARIAAGGYAVTLIDGVTGSGKTAVYFEAVAEMIRRSRQTLVLMPEIALTAQFLDRFTERFGVRYHARDMAVVRAHIAKIPIVLASATPSVETEVNARRGRYARLSLPERFGGQRQPAIEAIDLRREAPPRGRYIAPPLAEAVKVTLERGDQALLFLNRRGYAPLTLCRACGFRLQCPNCDAWLVDHRFRRRLVCHHCGFSMPPPAACPKCEAKDSFVACGPGVERLEEEVAALFPGKRILVLSSDLVATVERLREELADIEQGKVDLVIGTQLVAKGHHFPKLNLVGIVDADLGLGSGDPRAAEKSFQLLHQVVGRAGREAGRAGRGRGLIQTHQPDHPVMRALIAADREAFYAAEIAARERSG